MYSLNDTKTLQWGDAIELEQNIPIYRHISFNLWNLGYPAEDIRQVGFG